MSIVSEISVAIPTGTWKIDPVWSSLEFEVKKLGLMTIKGRVPGFEGTIVGGEHPSRSAQMAAMAPIPPAAPSVCPMELLVALMLSLAACSPKIVRKADSSAGSPC
jgi:hypothetical protein